MYLASPYFHKIMGKVRKISKGDLVKYHSHVWVVKRKRNGMVNLLRRMVNTGPPIWVPETRLKHADESWRKNLILNDPVSLFIGGHWLKARVFRREGSNVCIQPSFTSICIRLPDSSGHIARSCHNFPLWQEDITRLVMFQGNICLERGNGLMFPWTYGTSVPIVQRQLTFITRMQLPVVHTRGLPMKMYNQMSTEEIMHDIFNNSSELMHPILKKLAYQYINYLAPRYRMRNTDSIDSYVASALDNNDTRRVEELLSIGSNTNEWTIAEYALYRHFSRRYLVPKLHYNESLQVVELEIYWSGIDMKPAPSIRNILTLISTPMVYKPPVIEVHSSPEIAYALSRMLGMEIEPIEKLYLRNVGDYWLTENDGFCARALNTYGGVVNIPGIDFPTLVRELVRRSPLKTLIVVETDTLPLWKGFSRRHGSRREDDLVVVTTRSTLLRCWTSLRGFKRLICTAMPTSGTVYHDVIQKMPCNVRWAFVPAVSNHICGEGFNVFNHPPNDNAIISLTKEKMEEMGVLFPVKSVQKIICKAKHDRSQIVRNIALMPYHKRKEMLSKFLLKPTLVPAHIRGEKLDSYNGTLQSISEKFKINKNLLESRISETCAICLENISAPAVTPCGHVFCSVCATELDRRNINCALCRAKVHGFMRVSEEDTPGKIIMHKGTCYRVQDDNSWGAKYAYLKEHSDATFLTQFSSVKRALRKAFPKTQIVTTRALENGLQIHTSKLVMIEPGKLPFLDYAWAQDLEIISLSYTVNI